MALLFLLELLIVTMELISPQLQQGMVFSYAVIQILDISRTDTVVEFNDFIGTCLPAFQFHGRYEN